MKDTTKTQKTNKKTPTWQKWQAVINILQWSPHCVTAENLPGQNTSMPDMGWEDSAAPQVVQAAQTQPGRQKHPFWCHLGVNIQINK